VHYDNIKKIVSSHNVLYKYICPVTPGPTNTLHIEHKTTKQRNQQTTEIMKSPAF